jgi:glycerate 2-kinase
MHRLTDLARAMFAAALEAVQPQALLRQLEATPDGIRVGGVHCAPRGRLVVVALGKAAPGLAAGLLAAMPRRPDAVFVLTSDGVPANAALAPHLRRAGHPLPDHRGVAATEELLALLASLRPEDGVVLLLSGGASALLAAPLPGVELEEVVDVTRALQRAGAAIGELNVVRKHLLAATGGRLAAGCAAPIATLVLSDVPGDDLATIASGPTVGDPSSFFDALAVLERYELVGSFPRLARFFRTAAGDDQLESAKPHDPRLQRATTHLLGCNAQALEAAAAVATSAGLRPVVLTRTLRGEARKVGRILAAAGRAAGGSEPVALLAGGETTVQVRGSGCGGRNLELALAAAVELQGVEELCLLAGATDGVDGGTPAAGAVVDGSTVARGQGRGRDATAALEANDSWGFFAATPEAILTGPTGTNVADLAFVLHAGGRPQRLLLEAFRHLPATPPPL